MVQNRKTFQFPLILVKQARENKGIVIKRANFGFRAFSFFPFLFLSKTKGNWVLKNSKLTKNGITLTYGHKVGCKKKGYTRAILNKSEETNGSRGKRNLQLQKKER